MLIYLQLTGEAVVKSYALPGEDNKPFLAYLVPKDDATIPDIDHDNARQVQWFSICRHTSCQFMCGTRSSISSACILPPPREKSVPNMNLTIKTRSEAMSAIPASLFGLRMASRLILCQELCLNWVVARIALTAFCRRVAKEWLPEHFLDLLCSDFALQARLSTYSIAGLHARGSTNGSKSISLMQI